MRRTKRTNVFQVLGGIVFVVAALTGLMFFAGFWRTSSSYAVSAYVSNARGIAQDSTVFEAGLPVGLVTGIRRNGPDAILTLRIDSGPTPLPVDSKIQLGLRSLAGESDVLLYPGRSTQTVRNGGSLGLSQDQSYTEVDQILNQFAGPTEGRARQFFQGIGNGVQGEGTHLNQTVGGFASLVNDSPPLTSTLATQHNQVADIVQNFGNIMGAIGQRTQALDEFARGALVTFNDVAARDVAFKNMLVQFPFVIGTVKQASISMSANSSHIAPVLVNLANTALKLKPTLDLLTPAAGSGIKLVNSLGGASPALKNVLVNLEQLKPSASTALPAVHAVTCQVDPMARFIAPYGLDLANFFENFGAADSPYLHSHQLFGSLLVDPSSFVRGVQTQPAINSILTTLLNFGIFKKLGSRFGYHALPGPGHMSDPSIGTGIEGPVGYGLTHTYPHVTADCAK